MFTLCYLLLITINIIINTHKDRFLIGPLIFTIVKDCGLGLLCPGNCGPKAVWSSPVPVFLQSRDWTLEH